MAKTNGRAWSGDARWTTIQNDVQRARALVAAAIRRIQFAHEEHSAALHAELMDIYVALDSVQSTIEERVDATLEELARFAYFGSRE